MAVEDGVVARRMNLPDLLWVMAQHRYHFPDNVIGRLGRGLLARYYRTFLDSPFAVATVIEVAGERAGYLVGVLDTTTHRRLLWRSHGQSLAVAAAAAFLRHPALGAGIVVRRLQLRLRRQPAETQAPAERIAVLSHVAVHPDHQGHRLGPLLVDQFLASCSAAGTDRACVATADDAPRAARMYLRRGFVLTGRSRTFDGRMIRLYERAMAKQAT
ncbi:GNAT family N-acetyltransferase [Microlunatus sp. Y2014]|uniref:GNAT family N-acetyltransferase n=1 Tax=Microlunatus sp. Y2014 TaxID=3418488 RepID=UPI003DA741E7